MRPRAWKARIAVSGWIDLKTWKRRDHYLLFRKYERPFFSVTVDVDVTRSGTRAASRARPSFFLTSLFLMLNAVNAVEAFRLRLRPRGVWRHDRVAVGPTILPAGRDVRIRAASSRPPRCDQFVSRSTRAIAAR